MRKSKINKRITKRSESISNSSARVLIVGEGITEERYFEAIVKEYGLQKKYITVTASSEGSAPLKVAKSTCKEVEKAKNELNPYDHVFCVFDGDIKTGFKKAGDKILKTCKNMENKNDALACSWPCFEYWLILHFNNSSSPFEREGKKSMSDVCESKLKKTYDSNYKKGDLKCLELYMDKNKSQTAIKNAKSSRQRAETDGEDNPSSKVYKVLECLQKLKKTNRLPSA